MPEITFRYRVLPGGRRVRDVPESLTAAELLAETEESAEETPEPKPKRKRKGDDGALE